MNFMQYVGAAMGWLGIGPNMANVLIRLLDDPDVSRGYAHGSIRDMEIAQAMHPAWVQTAMAFLIALESVLDSAGEL